MLRFVMSVSIWFGCCPREAKMVGPGFAPISRR